MDIVSLRFGIYAGKAALVRKSSIGDAFCAVKAPAQSGGGLRRRAGRRMGVCPRRGRTGRPEAHGAGMRRKAMLPRLCGCDFMLIYAYITYCRRFAADYCICIIAFAFILCAAVVLPLRCLPYYLLRLSCTRFALPSLRGRECGSTSRTLAEMPSIVRMRCLILRSTSSIWRTSSEKSCWLIST